VRELKKRVKAGVCFSSKIQRPEKQTKAEQKLIALVKKPHKRELNIIQSIPRIGESAAARLITSVGDFKKFTSGRQVVSYLGHEIQRGL
jgi:transposase